MAASSKKVARLVFSKCGISDIKMLKSVRAKILPRRTPTLVNLVIFTYFSNLSNWYFNKYLIAMNLMGTNTYQ